MDNFEIMDGGAIKHNTEAMTTHVGYVFYYDVYNVIVYVILVWGRNWYFLLFDM